MWEGVQFVGKKTKVPEVSLFFPIVSSIKGMANRVTRELHMSATVIKLLFFQWKSEALDLCSDAGCTNSSLSSRWRTYLHLLKY